MRFVQFRLLSDASKKTRIGLQEAKNGGIIDLSDALSSSQSLVQALTNFGMENLIDKAKSMIGKQSINNSMCALLAPITSPDKVVCAGMNYKDHCIEQGVPIPEEPIFFTKFPSSIIGPFDDIQYPDITKELDWEAELAVVIGKKGKNIDADKAKDYIFGYTVAHDVSARDWQFGKNGGQWLLGKAMDGFCPLGPCVITPDEIHDPHQLAISCSVNGELKQNSNTSQIVHNSYYCISYLSKFCTLLPGDVILTGTPPGVGAFAKPPQFLKKGDIVECAIENIGILRNQVV